MSLQGAVDPLDAAHRFFSGLKHPSRVLVALSGGGDSMGLLVALLQALETSARGHTLCAATVDHALRDGSADEAAAMAAFCRDQGIEHRILVWQDEKPHSGLSEAARNARYRLLADAMTELRADLIATAHTADDQLETVEMRRRRSAEVNRGLSGMATSTLFFGKAWVLRPFLDVSRDDIRAFLKRQGVNWFDDPSNDNPAFERVRVRQDAGFQHSAAEIAGAAAQRRANSKVAAELISQFATMPLPLLFRMPLDPEMNTAVAALIAVAGGRALLPSETAIAGILADVSSAKGSASVSLNRTVVTLHKDFLYVGRDNRNLPAHAERDAQGALVWDGRFMLSNHAGPCSGPAMGEDAVSAIPPRILKRALAALPPQRMEGGLAFRPIAAPFATVLPDFDIELAQAVHAVMGLPPIPDHPMP